MSLGIGFGVSNAQDRPSDSPFLLLVKPDVEIFANSPALYLPDSCRAPCHELKTSEL